MQGGFWAVIAHQDYCLLVDAEGNRIGRLERIERHSPTLGAKAPKNGATIYSGTDTEQFSTARQTEEGLLVEGADVKPMFQDFNMHLEFKLSYMPHGRGQDRSSSGIYLQSRYEVQILDSFGLKGDNNECGALYGVCAPKVNMCFAPLAWQTYDIVFAAPRWASDGTKLKNARISVWHNGVKIHDDVELPSNTGSGEDEGPSLRPIKIQDHGDPARFRNLWLVDRGAVLPNSFPMLSSTERKEDYLSEPKEGGQKSASTHRD